MLKASVSLNNPSPIILYTNNFFFTLEMLIIIYSATEKRATVAVFGSVI